MVQARDAVRPLPDDASPILRKAFEIAQKTDRTPNEEHFLKIVQDGSYESVGKPGTVSATQVKIEAEKKINELETVAAQKRIAAKELTPEQNEKMLEATNRHNQMIAFLRGKYNGSPIERDSRIRNLTRDFEAEKLAIAGEATSKQLAKRALDAKSNFKGKDVTVDGEVGRVIGTNIRTVKVKFQDGREVEVPREKVTAAVIEAPDMTIGMTKAQLDEYQFLKENLDSGKISEIADRYGLSVSENVLAVGKLPQSVAESPVYQRLLRDTEIATKDRDNLPPDHADSVARLYYAMYQSIATKFTMAGLPKTVDQVFMEHMMHIVGAGGRVL
jgi:hypothetical protein